MIINKDRKYMEFEKIRSGTVFTFDDKTYLKCEGDAAVDVMTGEIIHPVGWDTCILYLKASLRLGG